MSNGHAKYRDHERADCYQLAMKTSQLLRKAGFAAALALVAACALAQPTPPPTKPSDCGSVVLVKCENRNPVESPDAAANRAERAEQQRRVESRRIDGPRPDLGRVIIEGERIRPLTVEESLRRAMPADITPNGTYTYSIGEGAQCTCMNVCPPWWTLMPCCACSDRTGSRLSTAPGSTPLR